MVAPRERIRWLSKRKFPKRLTHVSLWISYLHILFTIYSGYEYVDWKIIDKPMHTLLSFNIELPLRPILNAVYRSSPNRWVSKSCQIFWWHWEWTASVWPMSQIDLNQATEIAEGRGSLHRGTLHANSSRNIFVPDIEALAYKYAVNRQ